MKKKKSLLSLGLIALVLVLGVGYAVVTTVDLSFNGTATVADAQIKVDIASVDDDTTGQAVITHENPVQHVTTDKFTITGMKLNEKVTITYTVDNHETDVNALISTKEALTFTNGEYFDVKVTPAQTISANGTGTVVVEVTLKKTPVTTEQGTTNISFKLTATAEDNKTNN